MRPIVLIPGIGGSIIVNKRAPTRRILEKDVLHNRWLNFYPYSPKTIREWKQDMRIVVDRGDDGRIVGVRPHQPLLDVVDIGGTMGLKDVVPEFLLLPKPMQKVFQNVFQFRYFHDICEYLYGCGFEDRETLFGIPYDFRLVLDPVYRQTLFITMKTMIEHAYHSTNQQVVIVAHSLGGILFKWFVSDGCVDEGWVSKYVYMCNLISVPFGGSVLALKTVLAGDFYIPQLHRIYRDELQHNTGVIMTLPNTVGFDNNASLLCTDDDMIVTPTTYHRLADEGHVSFEIWRDLYEPHIPTVMQKVHMPTRIFMSADKDTPTSLVSSSLDSYPYYYEYSKGDGIIHNISYDIYARIFGSDPKVTLLKGATHTNIISHPYLMQYVKKLALE